MAHVTFRVTGIYISDRSNLQLAIVGNAPILGNWKPHSGKLLKRSSQTPSVYEISLEFAEVDIQYKYVILKGSTVCWEGGANRFASFQGDVVHTREEVWVQFCASSFIECELGDVVGGNTNSLLSDKRIFQSSECDTESRCSEDGGLSEAEYANGENEPGASNRDSPASGTERCIKRDTCEQKKAVQKHSEHSPPSLLLDKIISMFPKSSQSV